MADVLRPDAAGALEAWRRRVTRQPRAGRAPARGNSAARFLCRRRAPTFARIRAGRTSRRSSSCARWCGRARRGSTSAPAAAATPCRWRSWRRPSSPSSRPRGCGTCSQAGIAEHGISNIEIVAERWPMRGCADRRRGAHGAHRLRPRGDRPVPRRRRGLGAASLRGRARDAVSSVSGRAVLAAHPWRGARLAAGRSPSFSCCSWRAGASSSFASARASRSRTPISDGPLRWLYQQLFVAPDTAKGQRLAALARDAITSRDGRWALSWSPVPVRRRLPGGLRD